MPSRSAVDRCVVGGSPFVGVAMTAMRLPKAAFVAGVAAMEAVQKVAAAAAAAVAAGSALERTDCPET